MCGIFVYSTTTLVTFKTCHQALEISNKNNLDKNIKLKCSIKSLKTFKTFKNVMFSKVGGLSNLRAAEHLST